jgi:hypothetical protein
MQKFFGYALVAGLASFLAVVYTLLTIDWKGRPDEDGPVPAASAPVDHPHDSPDAKR